MLDAIAIERAGKPAVAIIGDEFLKEANHRKDILGMPSLQFVVVPFPLGPEAEARRKAEVALPDIVGTLTGQGTSVPAPELAAAGSRSRAAGTAGGA
ncbi:MAG: hypothetical protein HYY01_11760 [Chloroflexi bacterium]|nr:hypothetical protein [Chloroflexota bacterium]